jgi:hypothetical protein
MRIPLFSCLFAVLVLTPAITRASSDDYTLEIKAQGDNTYVLTRWASTGFARNTDKLKERALADAQAYCDKLHRVLKVIDVTKHRPFIPTTGFPYARVTFMALDPNDPILHAPASAPMAAPAQAWGAAPASSSPPTPTSALYSDLMKLEDLRQRGILTDDEFQKLKTRLINKSQ